MERFDFAEAAMDATMKVGARVRTCAFVSVCVCGCSALGPDITSTTGMAWTRKGLCLKTYQYRVGAV